MLYNNCCVEISNRLYNVETGNRAIILAIKDRVDKLVAADIDEARQFVKKNHNKLIGLAIKHSITYIELCRCNYDDFSWGLFL